MIKNKRGYTVVKSQVKKIDENLALIHKELDQEVIPELRHKKLLIDQGAFEHLREKLMQEIEEYEELLNGEIKEIRINGIHEIPELLIKARIAQGLTHKQLAEKLGWKEQQIQRYEANDYDSVGFGNLALVEYALGIHKNIKIVYRLDKENLTSENKSETHITPPATGQMGVS